MSDTGDPIDGAFFVYANGVPCAMIEFFVWHPPAGKYVGVAKIKRGNLPGSVSALTVGSSSLGKDYYVVNFESMAAFFLDPDPEATCEIHWPLTLFEKEVAHGG